MEKKQNRYDVVIAGGGVPGLALALLLGDLGLDVAVLEPQAPLAGIAGRNDGDGRTVALMASSVNILRAAGVMEGCMAHAAPMEILRIIDGETVVDFHAGEIGESAFGINIPNAPLRTVLWERAADHARITLRCPAAVADYTQQPGGVVVQLDDGETLKASLLVGADGRGSKTRTLAGIKTIENDPGQAAITMLIDHSRDHDFTSTEFHRKGGPFTLVPLPGRRSSVVWVEPAERVDALISLRRDDMLHRVQQLSENRLGRIEAMTPPVSWRLRSMRARDITAPRLALVAEAAHILHPMGAQGLNLSLRDIAVLAEEVADAARTGLDIGGAGVLDRYAARRRADILTRRFGTDSLNRMIRVDALWARGVRGVGLRAVGGIAPLRHFAMREGIAPGYDDGRLSRGALL